MDYPEIWILLTTYNREEYALRTIQALKQNFIYPNVGFFISDDGSPSGHVERLVHEIGTEYQIRVYNSSRRGVGHGMNHCLRQIFEFADLVLMMEDDWILEKPLEVEPYMRLLRDHPEYGLVRFGYLAAGLLGYLVSEEGKLFWRLESNGETYRYSGHPSLRHKRFHEQYGYYDEGLAPGWTELSMCGRVNQNPSGPHLVYPADCGAWGFFGHIGGDSLKDTQPER